MSYENVINPDANLGRHENLGNSLGHTLGKDNDIGPPASEPQKQPVYFNYQQTILKMPKFEIPKFRYDYGFPEYNRTFIKETERDYNYPSPYKVRDDRISQFFIGSATVVGLFILYRILEKNK